MTSPGEHREEEAADEKDESERCFDSSKLFTRPIEVRAGLVLRPIPFYVGEGCYDRAKVSVAIREHGGEVRSDQATNKDSIVVHLSDEHAKLPAEASIPAYKWTYITDCIQARALLQLERYKIPRGKPGGRPKGGTRRKKKLAQKNDVQTSDGAHQTTVRPSTTKKPDVEEHNVNPPTHQEQVSANVPSDGKGATTPSAAVATREDARPERHEHAHTDSTDSVSLNLVTGMPNVGADTGHALADTANPGRSPAKSGLISRRKSPTQNATDNEGSKSPPKRALLQPMDGSNDSQDKRRRLGPSKTTPEGISEAFSDAVESGDEIAVANNDENSLEECGTTDHSVKEKPTIIECATLEEVSADVIPESTGVGNTRSMSGSENNRDSTSENAQDTGGSHLSAKASTSVTGSRRNTEGMEDRSKGAETVDNGAARSRVASNTKEGRDDENVKVDKVHCAPRKHGGGVIWTRKEDKRVKALGGFIRSWREKKPTKERWSESWMKLGRKGGLLPEGRDWRDCKLRYIYLCTQMDTARLERQLTSIENVVSDDDNEGTVVDRRGRNNMREAQSDRQGVQSNTRRPSKAVHASQNRTGVPRSESAEPESVEDADASGDEDVHSKGDERKQSKGNEAGRRELKVSLDRTRRKDGSGRKPSGARNLQSRVEKRTGSRVEKLSQSRKVSRTAWNALFAMVPDVPPHRSQTVVEAVRVVSKRAGISQKAALSELIAYKGNFKRLIKDIDVER